MKQLFWLAIAVTMLTACGVKKDLKRPSEIQREEEHKQRKEQEKQQKKWESDGRV